MIVPRDRTRRDIENGGGESSWDGQGFEIEAKQVFDFRVVPRCVCVCVCVCVDSFYGVGS